MRSLPNIIKNANAADPIKPYEFKPALINGNDKTGKSTTYWDPETSIDEELRGAVTQAEEILRVAREESEKIREEAFEEGFQRGLTEGNQVGRKEAYDEDRMNANALRQQLEAEMAELIKSCTEQKQEILEHYLEDLKNLSVSVAEKVIQVSLKSSGDVIKRMIITATDTLKRKQWAKIYISKCDCSFLVDGDRSLLKSLSNLSDNIKIITMDQEESGTCIVELPDEIIDASVSTQLENIKDIINNARL